MHKESMKKPGFPGLALVTALALLAAGNAFADRKGSGHDRDREEKAEHVYRETSQGRLMPLASIMEAVRAAHPGRIVETEFEMDDGVPVYEFYIVEPGGRLLEVKADARTGAIIKAGYDD